MPGAGDPACYTGLVLRDRYDQLAKNILGALGELLGEIETEHEISGAAQTADAWFRPGPEHGIERSMLGVLGQMLDRPCLLEAFHQPPGGNEVLDCLDKLLTLRRNLLGARAAGLAGQGSLSHEPAGQTLHEPAGQTLHEPAGQTLHEPAGQTLHEPAGLEPHELPRLWILSAGRPDGVLRGLGFQPMDGEGWPPGFWRAPELLNTFLVVIRELPCTRDTLLLRLLGAGKTLEQAIRELRTLPEGAWEAELAIPLLVAFKEDALQNPDDEDIMNRSAELQAIYESVIEKGRAQGRDQGLKQGRDQGLQQGLRSSLLSIYRARFGEVPAELASALAATTDAAVLEHWAGLFATRSAQDIAATVHSHIGSSQPPATSH